MVNIGVGGNHKCKSIFCVFQVLTVQSLRKRVKNHTFRVQQKQLKYDVRHRDDKNNLRWQHIGKTSWKTQQRIPWKPVV